MANILSAIEMANIHNQENCCFFVQLTDSKVYVLSSIQQRIHCVIYLRLLFINDYLI